MATTRKKEYSLKINGLEKGIKDVTSLEEAVKSLDATIKGSNAAVIASIKTVQAKAKALTDEEKAAKKLRDTQEKNRAVQEGANNAQIIANQNLRESVRVQTRKIQITKLAEGSVKRLGMQLTDLRNEYMELSREERENSEIGGKRLLEIQAMDAEYKRLKESVGQFQDNVGNYGKALAGLEKLGEGMEGVNNTSMGLAQSFMGVNAMMATFGEQSEENTERTKALQKVMALLAIAQQINNSSIRKGIAQNKKAGIVDAVRTAQIKAKTAAEAASTKGTVAATIAQKTFNIVASANPYVILALALVAVGAALFAFASGSEKAADKQKKLNELQSNYLDKLDEEARKLNRTSTERVEDLERQLRVLKAQGAKQEDIRKLEDKIAAERKRNNAELRKIYKQEIDQLDNNIKRVDALKKDLLSLDEMKKKGAGKVELTLDGKLEKMKIDDAINTLQGRLDNVNKKVGVAVELKTQAAEEDTVAQEEAAKRAKEAEKAAQDRAKIEMDAVRASEDAKLKLIQNTNEQAKKLTETNYNRQIDALRERLKTETDLSKKARIAINENIKSLEAQKDQDLKKLQEDANKKTLELQRQAEDSRAALIVSESERRRAEINLQYDRLIEDNEKRLEEDKSLTAAQQKAITEIILNAHDARANELNKLMADDLNDRAELELQAIEEMLYEAERKIDEVVSREKTGLELIDVDATRKNLEDVNKTLDTYISGLSSYLGQVKEAHQATLLTLQEGTPEYDAEMQKYARTVEEVNKRISDAQDKQTENTQRSAGLQIEALQELFGKIGDYAAQAVTAISSVFDTWNMGLQVQLDDLNEQLEVINERYKDAQKLREESVKNVEALEAQLQSATGGTAEALKEQLQDATHARNEAAREEKRLAKEKEKREAEIAKKEKQMKRNELIGSIAMAIANTAAGMASALKMGIPGIIMAGVIGAMGAVQVGVMARQLTKLEKGGEIKGPSHANGGVPIPGTNYEAEGGEFVVNRKSYSANTDLVKFINDSPRSLTAADLLGVLPGNNTPVIVTDAKNDSEDRIVEAIEKIEMRPTVAVTDIIDTSEEVVEVRDLSGF